MNSQPASTQDMKELFGEPRRNSGRDSGFATGSERDGGSHVGEATIAATPTIATTPVPTRIRAKAATTLPAS